MYCACCAARASPATDATRSNAARSSFMHLVCVVAVTVAARGLLRSSASSPKKPPAPYSNTVSPSMDAVAAPSSTKYMQKPASPCFMMSRPSSNTHISSTSTSLRRSAVAIGASSGTVARNSAQRAARSCVGVPEPLPTGEALSPPSCRSSRRGTSAKTPSSSNAKTSSSCVPSDVRKLTQPLLRVARFSPNAYSKRTRCCPVLLAPVSTTLITSPSFSVPSCRDRCSMLARITQRSITR